MAMEVTAMTRSVMVRRLAPFFAAVAFAFVGSVHAEEGQGIVAPSEYVEDIETPGDTGGVMDEVDSAQAQAEAAAKAKAEEAKKADAEEADAGGW